MKTPIEKVQYTSTFRMIPDDRQVYKVLDGYSAGQEHKLPRELGKTVCVANIRGDQKLMAWGTEVEETVNANN